MIGTFSVFSTTGKWLSEKGWAYSGLPLTASTSDLAKEAAFTDPELMIYLAEEQSQGRGRGSATWSSPAAGGGLLATWSFLVDRAPQPLTAPLVGLAVYQAVLGVWSDLPWSLKAPNDLYLGDKKIAGILVESISRGNTHRLLIGIGMNVTAAPKDVAVAGHLSESLKSPLTEAVWFEFLHRLHQGFMHVAQESSTVALAPAHRAALAEALRRNPNSRDLKDVTMEGTLVFPDRSVDWHSLQAR